jgi:hypothetical protein
VRAEMDIAPLGGDAIHYFEFTNGDGAFQTASMEPGGSVRSSV